MNSGTLWTDVMEKYPFPPWPIEVAYENRGNYLAKEQNELDKGLADYQKLVMMKSKNHKIYSNMGNIYGLKGQELEKAGKKDMADAMYNKSAEAFTESIRLNPGDSKTFVNRAITYTFMGRHDLAAADFDVAHKLDPDNLEIIEKRAYAYYNGGRPAEAIADYDKLIASNPSNNNLLLHRGIARFNSKRYAEAIEDFTLLLSREPKNGNAYFNISVCYARLGDKNNALLHAQKAQEFGYPVDSKYLSELQN
jgi:tetratricopeptide (TPR) repeat protein